MRIVFVTHAYPRWDGDVAGVFIERLAAALVARGHELHVVAPADEGRGGDDERHGVRVCRVRYAPARRETLAYRGTMVEAVRSLPGILVLGSLLRAMARGVARVCRAVAADVIHAHWWIPGGIAALRARAAPYVVTLHGTDVALLERARVARLLAGRVLRRAAALTAVSSYLAERTAALTHVNARAIGVRAMPLDVAAPTSPGRGGGGGGGGGGVVTVGRLTQQKRVHLVLEAVARLREQGRGLHLTVVGDGPERGRLEQTAQRLGIAADTRFLGAVEPASLPAVMRDADVMAFPAVREGFGLAAAEALMLGIPVVAMADGGGVRDVVPAAGGGRIVAAGDAAALARAIAELAGSSEARRAAVAAGEALARRLAPDAVAQWYEGVYRGVHRA